MACKILVADGDANIRSVLEYRLRREGCAVLLSGNGADALERARAEEPDLIVLDLALPQPEGSGFRELLLSEAANRGIPVLALTIYGDKVTGDTGYESRAFQVIVKPFSARKLVADIGKLLCGESGRTDQRQAQDLATRPQTCVGPE